MIGKRIMVEKIEIIDSSKTIATVKNLNSYFQNIGYLNNKVD